MIYGIGVDAVEIERFRCWHRFSHKQLSKIYTPSELAYCLENPIKSAERFAVRFAAKEAFYKAGEALLDQKSFYALARHVGVLHGFNQKPTLIVDWQSVIGAAKAEVIAKTIKIHLSLTHTDALAIAYVIIEYI